MNDLTQWILGALALVLGAAAVGVGGQIIRDAWRGAFDPAQPVLPGPKAGGGREGRAPAFESDSRPPGLMRSIAGFEAFKGLLTLAAALGLLGFMHHDPSHVIEVLIGQIGLRPDGHYPALVLGRIDHWLSADLVPLMLMASGYVVLRLAEAYGLWFGRAWGERLGAWSGALYVPFELQHLIHRPSAVAAAVLLTNLAVVAYLAWQLWRRRAAQRGGNAQVP